MPASTLSITDKRIKFAPATLALFMYAAQLEGEALDTLLAGISREIARDFCYLADSMVPHFVTQERSAPDTASAGEATRRMHWLALSAKARADNHIR